MCSNLIKPALAGSALLTRRYETLLTREANRCSISGLNLVTQP